MAQASRSVVVNVPPEKFYEVVVDYASYPEFLPEVKKISIHTGSNGTQDVTYTVDIKAKLITYTLRHMHDRPVRVSWSMIKGEMMKGNDGFWHLKPGPGPETTEATYTIDLKLSALVPGFIEKALAENSLPGLLGNFKARAEKVHGR